MSRYLKMGLLGALAMLGGCATMPSGATPSIAEVGAGMVSGCRLLGVVHGSSLMDGVLQSKGVESAKRDAKAQAAKWGANTVVWTNITQRYWGAELVNGDAYRCNSKVASANR